MNASPTIGRLIAASGALSLAMLGGCVQHKVETAPIEIKPIHITVDVNVRVDERLDNFFAFEDKIEEKVDLRK